MAKSKRIEINSVDLDGEKKKVFLQIPASEENKEAQLAYNRAFKEALQPSFKEYQQQILKNANAMAEQFIKRGYKVVSGGTDDHLFLVDFIDKGITGKDVDAALGRANITVNKNSVPNDPQSPFVTSGIRVGTPAPTTRGFKEAECKDIVDWMCDVIENMDNDEVINEVKNKVVGLCKKFPVYGKSQSKAAAA